MFILISVFVIFYFVWATVWYENKYKVAQKELDEIKAKIKKVECSREDYRLNKHKSEYLNEAATSEYFYRLKYFKAVDELIGK